jgi:hypothetical protein
VNPALLADLIVAVHVAIVVFVIAGALLVFVGGALRWTCVRNPWFRLPHLGVVLYIAAQAATGELCPLTAWEYQLRREANQRGEEGTFVGGLLHDTLFLDVPQETLSWIYIGFGTVVLASLWLVPPRWHRTRSSIEPSNVHPELHDHRPLP